MKKLITLAALCLGITLSASTLAASKDEASKAVEAAVAAQKQAASVGGEWRDTDKIIKAAQKALEAGDFDEAMKQAKKAQEQGTLGYQQAEGQKSAGIPAYMTK